MIGEPVYYEYAKQVDCSVANCGHCDDGEIRSGSETFEVPPLWQPCTVPGPGGVPHAAKWVQRTVGPWIEVRQCDCGDSYLGSGDQCGVCEYIESL